MVGNGSGEIGQHPFRRQSSVNSPRRLSRPSDPRDFDSLMELPKLLQRGVSFKTPSPARHQQLHSSNAHTARSACQKNIWVTVVLCSSCLIFLYCFFLRRGQSVSHSFPRQSKGFGVVIDVGQKDARINIFGFEDTETLSIKVLGRNSSLVPLDFEAVGGKYDVSTPLFELLEYAEQNIPEIERPQTRVYVVLTGELDWVGTARKFELLQECRNIIQGSEFQFHADWATVVSGREEAVYEWVAANYAHGMLQSDPADTIGVLTLGDESAQVTFIPEEIPPPAYRHKIELWGTTHNLYSHRFEKLGLERASHNLLVLLHSRKVTSSTDNFDSEVIIDPCTPRGYGLPNRDGKDLALATGNFTACRAESLALLQQGRDACLDKKCLIGTTYVPELRGNFILTGNFYQTLKYFSLPATASIADLVAAGEKYCGQDWSVGDSKVPYPEYEDVRKPCFSTAYIVAFLHDSFGLPVHGNKVMFTDAVNSVPVEWTVGVFITHLFEEKAVSFSQEVIFGEPFGNVALFLGLVLLGGLLLWFVVRWRRPQLKTIYDLEKGRYIMTAARGR